ncbi:MAG: hypothetical protein JW797_06490 [Bradymonadales bacterium]|nr:hypothetical protein [Bradymonadales bacterium]
MIESPFALVLADLAQVLERSGVSWYLFGGQAALIYGSARLTGDVDITVFPGRLAVDELVRNLESCGFKLRVVDDQFLQLTGVLLLIHLFTSIPVDIVLGQTGLEEQFLGRAVTCQLGTLQVCVACPEDMVAMKILSGRPKDVDDATAIIAARGDQFNQSLVVETLGLLERALDRSDLVAELARILELVQRT